MLQFLCVCASCRQSMSVTKKIKRPTFSPIHVDTYCYHGDEDALRDPRSVETRPHAKRGNPTHSTRFTDRRGYAQRITSSSLVRKCPETRCGQVTRRVMNLAIPGTRRRGRPNKTGHHQIKDDMTCVGVTKDVALDRNEWRRRTRPTPRR